MMTEQCLVHYSNIVRPYCSDHSKLECRPNVGNARWCCAVMTCNDIWRSITPP